MDRDRRTGGFSLGADEEVERICRRGGGAHYSVAEVPDANRKTAAPR